MGRGLCRCVCVGCVGMGVIIQISHVTLQALSPDRRLLKYDLVRMCH